MYPMIDVQRAITTWRRSRHVAKQQAELTKCPCCLAGGAEFLFDPNKFASNLFVARGLARGRYSLCYSCGAVFAALRPRAETAQSYYDLFKDGRRDKYPPETVGHGPAKHIVKILEEQGLLRSGMAVLHVRCDTGALLQELRIRVGDATLQGLDYFETYVKYVREQGFAAARLNPGKIELPFGIKYDLIISNHQLTHAIEPRGYLDRLCGALNVGGHILFYSEIDHDIQFDPASKYYVRSDMISYHKQLFVKESLEALLSEAGLESKYLGHQRTKMMFLCRRNTLNAARLPVSPDVVERQRRRITAWQKALPPRRPVMNSLYWLMHPAHEAHDI